MELAQSTQNEKSITRVSFESPLRVHSETLDPNAEFSSPAQVVAAWLIQLARYWSIDKIDLCIKYKNDLNRNVFTQVAFDTTKADTWLKLITTSLNEQKDFDSPDLAPSDNPQQKELQQYCIICPIDSIVGDAHLIQIWQQSSVGLQMLICGDSSLFPKLPEQSINSHFTQIIRQLSEEPQLQLDSIECLSNEERKTIVELWNDTDRAYPIDHRVDQLFDQQVNKTPNNIAIRFNNTQFSYLELSQKIDQFAQFLIEQKVTEGQVVGLCLTRTPLWPIGMLAIWKVGGIFLPLEAELPDERLSYILQDSDCSLVVTEEQLAQRFDQAGPTIVTVNLSELTSFSEKPTPVNRTVDTLAYIIYTSGTTGLPKGVKVNHRGLSNLAYCQYERLSFEPNQRILQAVSFNFDASLHDVTFALLSGSTLCIADENERLPGLAMVEFLRNERINFITLPPSALETLPFEDLPELHTILAVGEVCGSGLVNRWAGIKKFFNGYGPTETTVGALIGECFSNEEKPTIGTALANVKIYILDARLKPVPIGVIGEIYVGGVGVARGYMNQPKRTAQSFIANPFSKDGNSTLYKTGDKARFLEDGRVDFIGRIDDQVKIAGRRIEIEEIEARCKAFEQIKNAAVVVHKDKAGNKFLRAFVLIDQPTSAQTYINALKLYLSKYLPSYMLPVQYFVLKEFPTSINGKLGRKTLESIETYADKTLDEISSRLSLQNIELVFKGIGNNIYLPICYFASSNNSVSKHLLEKELLLNLPPFSQPFSLFSLGHLPKIDTPLAIEQLPTPTEFENKWKNLRSRPTTPTQLTLAGIWLRELNTNEVFLDDNFVDNGGDSIKAVKIILEIKNETGIELSGADLFGSDFGYCAARLESEITGNPIEISLPGKVDIPETVSVEFFESQGNKLYSVFHPPLADTASDRAVLICSGITNDYQRARPMLQKLASRLCAAGFPSMRFDYFGCGDSEGYSEEITLDHLKSNLQDAIKNLRERSGCNEVVLFGVRIGANLITETALPNEVSQVILFDPLQNGAQFINSQRIVHRSILNDSNYFQWRKNFRVFEQYEEILGQSFSHTFIKELLQLDSPFSKTNWSLFSSKHCDEDFTKLVNRVDLLNSKNTQPLTFDRNIFNNKNERKIQLSEHSIDDDCGWLATDKIDTTIIAKNLFHQVLKCLRGN